VIGLTRTMAKEWGRYNVNVNAVGSADRNAADAAWTDNSKMQ